MQTRALFNLFLIWCSLVLGACIAPDSGTISQATTAPDTIELTPTSATLPVQATQKLTATGHYGDGSKKNLSSQVTWTSSNPGVATVSSTGVVTAVHSGSAMVTAVASGGATASAPILVDTATLVSFTLSPATPMLVAGTTKQLTAVGKFSDGTRHDLSPAVLGWTSSTSSVATVSASGLVASSSVGTATISAHHPNGATATATVTVGPAKLKSIALTPSAPTFPIGVTVPLTATGTYTDGTTADLTASATWGSATPANAIVTDAGVVQTFATGTSVVTATLGTIKGSTTVHVSKAQMVSLEVASPSSQIPAGSSQLLVAIGQFDDGSSYDVTLQSNWSSSNPGVAQVSNSVASAGLVTAISPGSAAISATDPTTGVVGTAGVQVNPAVIESLFIDGSSVDDVGQSIAFRTIASYSNGTSADVSQSVAWSTSDPSIGTVSTAPNQGGVFLGEGLGNVTLTAFYAATNQSASVSVHVKAVEQTSLQVTPTVLRLPLGYSDQLTAYAVYDNNSNADVTGSVTWTSDNPAVATVSASGRITSVGLGTAHVTAKGPLSPSISQVIPVTVEPAVFAQPTTYAVGGSPLVTKVADLDHDGHADLIVADYYSGLHLLFGRGDGSFADGGELDVGGLINYLAVGDLDGDGHLDLVAANYTAETITIRYGHGDGTFEPSVVRSTGSQSFGIVLGDTNDDGHLDLVYFTLPGHLLIARGHGDRTFDAPIDIDLSGPFERPQDAGFADFNGDGHTDLVVANSNSVVILESLGNGSFAAPVRYSSVASTPKALAVGDFNGDGRPDVAVANSSSDKVTVFLDQADGSLSLASLTQVGDGPIALAVADFDGDGHLDFASANEGANTGGTSDITVALGHGDGTFGVPYSMHIGGEATGVVAFDFDGDGHPDLATCSETDNSAYLIRNQFAGH